MSNNLKNTMKTISLALLLTLLILPLVASVGVANSYWDEKPLKLAPGEGTQISLRLQNEETEAITMEVSLDSPIASLPNGNTYEVPPGRVSVPVYLDVKIPEDASVGTDYTIYTSFKQISSGEGEGFFQVAQGITSKVPVEIVGEEESELYGQKTESNISLWMIGLIVLVIAVFVAILISRKRRV